jgi:RNA polymerase sigma factor (sigma-70 family)
MFTNGTHSQYVTSSSYAEQRSYVLSVLRRRCRWLEAGDCEALLHDAYVVLLEKERSGALILNNAAQVRAYLTQTALHKALDERKSARRRLSVSLEIEQTVSELVAAGPSPEDVIVTRSERAHLAGLLAELPERRRSVLRLRLLCEQTPEEIQHQLGITARVYRRELERGRRALADRLGAPGELSGAR